MKNIWIRSFGFLLVFNLSAQENLNREVIDVVKDFKPKIIQANKINAKPIFVDTTKVSENLKYNIRFEHFNVYQNVDSLFARIDTRPNLPQLYPNEVQLGLGNLLNPFTAISLGNKRSTRSMFHSDLTYKGAFSSAIPVEDKFSHFESTMLYKKVFEKSTSTSRVILNDLYRLDENEFDYRNTTLKINSKLHFADSSIFIPNDIEVSSYAFFRNFNPIENSLNVETLHEGTHDKFQKWTIKNKLQIQKAYTLSYLQYCLNVNATKSTERSRIKAGISIDALNESVKVFPMLRAQYKLIDKGLYAYTEFGGNRSLYSWANLYTQNPFIKKRTLTTFFNSTSSNQNMFDFTYGTQSNTEYYSRVGLNGSLFKGVSYQVALKATTQDNFVHFVHFEEELETSSESSFQSWMSLVYTDVQAIELNAEIDAKWSEKLHLWLKAEYRSMNKYLSYIPNLQLGTYLDYSYNDQWFLSASARYIGQRDVLTFTEGIQCYVESVSVLDPVLDVRLKINFALNKDLSFYLDANNLLNQDFILWQEEPILGRNLNFGARYRF